MSLSIGIVGLPNVGKSTLFNALLKKQQALAANYPFATIEPNVGIVPVPDSRLQMLAETVAAGRSHKSDKVNSVNQVNLVFAQGREREPQMASPDLGKEALVQTNLPPIVPATVTFTDIAGLVKGASEGEGLGNAFLGHIRETSAIALVVRAFEDPDVVGTGSGVVAEDVETVVTELILADMKTIENQKSKIKGQNDKSKLKIIYDLIENGFNAGKRAADILSTEQLEEVKDLFLLTTKPVLYVVNVGETQLQATSYRLQAQYAEQLGVAENDVVVICARVEAELSEMNPEDQIEYLTSLGFTRSGLERLIAAAYIKLRLQSFLTAGEKEVRAWTIPVGATGVEAATVIHTDFGKKFIKADVIDYREFVRLGGWKKAREVGAVRSEGRDYVMRDGDVVEFKIGA